MTDLIKVSYDNDNPTVLGRDLHEMLEVKTAYKDWFPRMCEYGFEEGKDFCSILSESTGGRPATDHQLIIDMAKQICMIQRTEKGKLCREYFLGIEKQWNTPEAVMARALRMADKQISALTQTVKELQTENQQLKLPAPSSARYYTTTEIAQSYGMTVKKLNMILGVKGLIYCEKKRWHLYYKHKDKGFASKNKSWFRWTEKGLNTIREMLKADGIVPLEVTI